VTSVLTPEPLIFFPALSIVRLKTARFPFGFNDPQLNLSGINGSTQV